MATNPSLVGRVLAGRYRIESRRGAGDHGVVLDAFDEQLERVVAVKLLLPHYVANTAAEARFRFEAQAAASLTHPNLNAVYDWGVEEIEDSKVPYLVLEHIGGGSLRDILDRGRLLSPSQALVVGLDVCRGLDYMHRRGVIHRELKPANLGFGDDRHVRILDVGLSRLVAEETWRDPTLAGLDAAKYASPEQARGGSPADGTLDASTDIYSLTLILIEAVTGQVPFTSDSTVSTLNARVDKLMPVSADLGPLASVLSRAGSAVPSDRYTAAEFGRALVQAAEKLPRPAPIPIVGAGLSVDDTGGMRRPGDPTGPMRRFPEGDPSDGTVRSGQTTAPIPIAEAVPPAPVEPVPPVAAALRTNGDDFAGSTTLLPLLVNDPAPPPPVPIDPATGQPPGPPALPFEPSMMDPSGPTNRPVLYDEGDVPPRRHRKRWALIALFLLVAVAAGAAIAYLQLREKSYAVPNLVGVEEAVARNLVAGHDWTIKVEKQRDDLQEQNHIISTDPPAGVKLKEGETITFVVSQGPTLSKLPDVTGQDIGQATALLDANKLEVEVAEEVYDENIPAGTVIDWTVPIQPSLRAGVEVPQGTVVAVRVSKGPEPRTVPQLVGLDPAAAQAKIDELQLVLVRDPADRFSNDYPAGIIVDQSQPAGSQIDRGGTVTIAVSKGQDLVAVPPLAGLTYSQTVAALESAGLKVGGVDGNKDTGVLYDARVNGKTLAAGQQLLRDTPVDVSFF